MQTVIVAGSPHLDLTPYLPQIAGAALIIAADGGALPLVEAAITPHLLIGDLDSLDAEVVADLAARGVHVERYPAAKDETDLELALLAAASRGATRIDVYGALGGRWDHTLANVALLGLPALKSIPTRLLADGQEIYLVRDQAIITGAVGETVSLLPIGGPAIGVSSTGLLYPLAGSTLSMYQARGVSNELTAPRATVQVTNGALIVVHTRQP